MRTAKLLAAATFAFASLPLLMAQQVDATAQQNASASAAGTNSNQSANGDANANVNHGHADASASSAANGSASAHGNSASASSDGSAAGSADMHQVTGQLESKLDSKTAKAGDEVVLKTSQKMKTAEGVVIPKGSRLIGHVTEVQAHSKQQAESRLGLAFDRAELRGGQSMAIHSMIESIAPSASAMTAASMADEEAMETPMGGGAVAGGAAGGGRIGSGLVGGATGGAAMATSHIGSGVGSTAGSAVRATSNASGAAAGTLGRGVNGTANAANFVGARATGIQGVMLNGDAAASASGTLSSANRNIHLDSGTQMVLGIAAAR
jgi:hypothetical protein